jgi:hypothetical protein
LVSTTLVVANGGNAVDVFGVMSPLPVATCAVIATVDVALFAPHADEIETPPTAAPLVSVPLPDAPALMFPVPPVAANAKLGFALPEAVGVGVGVATAAGVEPPPPHPAMVKAAAAKAKSAP